MTADRKHRRRAAPKRRAEEWTLTIEGVDEDGLGRARHEGTPVVVFDALPGEQVVVRVVHAGRHKIIAETHRVLRASPDRRARIPCNHHRRCQGCALLSWTEAAQLSEKHRRVTTALANYPSLAGITPAPVWASPEPLGYRASAKLVVARQRGGSRIGLYRRGTHEVVDIGDCPLHHPLINRVVSAVREELARQTISVFDPATGRGLLRYLLVRVSPAFNTAMVTLVTSERNYREVTHVAKWLQRKVPEVVSIHQNVNASSGNVIIGRETKKVLGQPDLVDQVGEVRLRLGPTSFLQVHHAQAGRIYRQARDWCDLRADQSALDLYCGVGGISLHLAPKASTIVGIEAVAEAVRHARANAAMNGLTNCRFEVGTAEQLLTGGLVLPDPLGAIVVNPPRSGCAAAVLEAIVALRPRRLVYVSCHPGTLARDLDHLVTAGLRLEALQPVDMFPQTAHVESLALLTCGSG